MTIGLYFGSFNPIHTGHLIIANLVLNETSLQKIWFVISPHNPFKERNSLLEEHARFILVQKSIKGDSRLAASDIEFTLPKPSYTINTLNLLREKYPQHQFSLVMGSDSFAELENWKQFQEIIDHHQIFIYPRPGSAIDNKISAKIEILHAPLLDISSTAIRKLIRDKKSIRYLVPERVRKEIEKNGYYKK